MHLIFNINEGPSVKIRKIDFIGNTAISDGRLKRQMKATEEQWFLSFITGSGTYQETKFDDDAGRIVELYQNRGYIKANVGVPEAKVVGESKDKKTRWIELRIPVTEGPRYRVGTFDFSGNTVVRTEALKPVFGFKEGDYYSLEKVRKGLDKAREGYGVGGYFEFTGFPDYKFRDEPDPADAVVPDALKAAASSTPGTPGATGPAIVDVTMRFVEGEKYFIKRITFVGNSTTRDNVIRRELRLRENGVFDTEALKSSVRRINQLGYFKALEVGRDIAVDKTPGATNQVDVELKLEEQNRNQISFGAGISEFEGFFGPGFISDGQLPRPWRKPDAIAFSRLPCEELRGGLCRTVPVRPERDRQHQCVQERGALHQPVHAAFHRHRRGTRISDRWLYAAVHQLQLRAHPGD